MCIRDRNMIKENAEVPHQWNLVDITTLYKKKGQIKDLVNQRGIFLTVIAYKLMERLIKNRVKEPQKRINLLQAGGREKRCTSDQTFIMRCLINHALYLGRKLFITTYDYKQCFDKLWLQEALLSQWRLGVHPEFIKLMLELNKISEIAVKTPFGETDRFRVNSITKQGTVTGPSLCCSSLGEVLDLHRGGGVPVGSVSVPTLAFVDDINNLQTKISEVHSAHEKTIWFSKRKNQPLNKGKCEVMCVNTAPGDAVPELYIEDHPVKCTDKIKYVGDVFNQKGSNKDLIDDRKVRGTICIRGTLAECSDITLGQYAIESLMLMYRAVFIQVVLFNGGAWCKLQGGVGQT